MVLPIAYFPPISWFKALLKGNAVIEQHENYVKQTIRNRCQIATANGVLRLSIPVVKAEKTTDVLIASHDNWQQKQWNAIATAYGESAFFDYYADDLKPFFTADCHKNLFEHNVSIIRKLLELIDIDDITLCFTDSFIGENYTAFLRAATIPSTSLHGSATVPEASASGLKPLAISHHPLPSLLRANPYYQVFRSKTGFLPDLSILDLLFNLGPEAACYLLKE